ncbi:MAG: DUF4190 domain-containing protein [Anaerolineaceae bacterium]|jgi:uncharacterized membrane protein|nr:DUF4190 domain-containing protein [Anaerolineaceae bacterium]MDD4043408.1 DUF4190 domain-containing protein [Anaerolineaceae bacterium]MDD4578008.1 DUF4190 domain-containing protein [Anaerolineaceae bacterium]
MSENQDHYENVEETTSVWAILSLISGIANYVGLWFIGAIVAIVTGYVAKNEIEKSNGKIGGMGLAKAGLILGWVGIAVSVLMTCLIILVAIGVLGGSIALCGPFSDMINQIPWN